MPNITINHNETYEYTANVFKDGQGGSEKVIISVPRNNNKLDFNKTETDFSWKLYINTKYMNEILNNWPGVSYIGNFLTGTGTKIWNQGKLFGDTLDYASALIGGGRNIRNEFKNDLHSLNPYTFQQDWSPRLHPQGLYMTYDVQMQGTEKTNKITAGGQP